MVIGIGTDLLAKERLHEQTLEPDDPFARRAFTEREREQAAGRANRIEYLRGRFCAKEAVYKAISICGEEFRPKDIEVIDDENEHPHVMLHGRTAEALASCLGALPEVLVSLSYEDSYVSAFALAQIGERGERTHGCHETGI